MNQVIEVTISPQGETKVETRGFTGSSCQEATRFLKNALGTTEKEQRTPEFYTQQTTKQQAQTKT